MGDADGFTPGETERQIKSLWLSHGRLEQKLEANTREIMVVSTQVPYIVSLLERIDKGQCAQSPICAVRGTKLEALEKKLEELSGHGTEIETLKSSNRILKWFVGTVTAVATIVMSAKLLDFIG